MALDLSKQQIAGLTGQVAELIGIVKEQEKMLDFHRNKFSNRTTEAPEYSVGDHVAVIHNDGTGSFGQVVYMTTMRKGDNVYQLDTSGIVAYEESSLTLLRTDEQDKAMKPELSIFDNAMKALT